MNLSPDWVITGAPHSRGVKVTASKNVKGGSVIPVQRAVEATGIVKAVAEAAEASGTLYQHDHYRVTVLAEDLVEAVGPDYPTALRMLFSIWQVPEPPQPVREIFRTGPETDEDYDDAMQAISGAMTAIEILEASLHMSDEERSIAEQITAEEP